MSEILVHYDPNHNLFESLVPWHREQFLWEATSEICSWFRGSFTYSIFDLIMEMVRESSGESAEIKYTPASLPVGTGYLTSSIHKLTWMKGQSVDTTAYQFFFHIGKNHTGGTPIWVKTLMVPTPQIVISADVLQVF